MSGNIMQLLRQIQKDFADQKENIRNLNAKIADINNKIDKQQISIENIEQHVKKNSVLLFGKDDTLIEDTTIESNKIDFENNEKDSYEVEKTEKYMDNIEADRMQEKEKTELNGEGDIKNSDSFEKADNDKKSIEEFITNEITEMKESIINLITTTKSSIEETAEQTDTNAITNQIYNLSDELKNISDIYQTDMKGIKESINDIVATIKISTEESAAIASTEQISKLCFELKQMNDTFEREIQAKKEIMDDVEATINTIKKVAASRDRRQVNVQITPTYLNTEQIAKLNEELKRITEMYISTDVFRIIEVQSGPCDHPVMELLSKGVYYYKLKSDADRKSLFKLGPNNFKRSEVLNVINEYPDLSLFQVIRAIGTNRNVWARWCETINFSIAYYNTADGLKPINN